MSDRILVIDDEKNIRRTFGMVLRAEGFAVSDAASGEAGPTGRPKSGSSGSATIIGSPMVLVSPLSGV